jgi:hypothetical protein
MTDEPINSRPATALHRNGTMSYFENSRTAAQYVHDRIANLSPGSQSIMTINHWKSGVFSVLSATSALSADIQTPLSSRRRPST